MLQSVCGDSVVMTTSGPLQGISIDTEGSELEAFLGIPYAEPPVGRLRFAKPVPKTSWSGVYDASKLAPTCIQNITQDFYYTPDVSNMTEDCLYLNVWVPNIRLQTKLKPILFFIHGGAFMIGSSNMKVYDGAKLAARGDVVVVSVNYRVGVMGFFSAFIPDADGNMGLYDQVLAVKWIKENAASFGGDPEHIVLIGQSAGAMSAAAHIISPLIKHMVKRVIMESGGVMLPIIVDENARLYKASQLLASILGCADKTTTLKTNPSEIVTCLKRLSAKELSRAEGIMMINKRLTFIPRMGDAFLPKSTIELTREGAFSDVEMLSGITKDEGTLFLASSVPEYFGVYGVNAIKTLSKRLAYQITRMVYKILGEPNESDIADFYVNTIENGTSDKYTLALSESVGDYLITCNTVFQSEFHSAKRNPVYFYKFNHRPSVTPLAAWMGTAHADEIAFVFGNSVHGNFTEKEEKMSQRMMDRWIAFVKTGNPNIEGEVKWPLYTYEYPNYLEIDLEDKVGYRPDNFRCEFWRERYRAVIDENIIRAFHGSASYFASKIALVFIPAILVTIV